MVWRQRNAWASTKETAAGRPRQRRSLSDWIVASCPLIPSLTLRVEPRTDAAATTSYRRPRALLLAKDGVPFSGKMLASPGKMSMLQPEPLRWPRDAIVLIGPGPEYQEISLESNRQFYPQGQRHRARREAVCRADGREHPSRQGNTCQSDRNAPHQRRREDFGALQDHR